MKQIFTFIAILIGMVITPTSTKAYDFEVDGIYYNIISVPQLTCAVTNGDKGYSGKITLPETVEFAGRQFKVEEIARGAFENSDIIDIEYPSTIKAIGPVAFSGCSNLKTIVIPETVSTISNNCYSQCNGLKEVIIPSHIDSIGSSAFSDCKELERVIFPMSLKYIGSYAFSDCPKLDNVVLPSCNIDKYCFENCQNLKNIEIQGSIKRDNNSWVIFDYHKEFDTITAPIDYYNIGSDTYYFTETLILTNSDSGAFYSNVLSLFKPENLIIRGGGRINTVKGNSQSTIVNLVAGIKTLKIENTDEYVSFEGSSVIGGVSFYGNWKSLKELYIDNSVSGLYYLPETLKMITYGPNIKRIPIWSDSFTKIICLAIVPPILNKTFTTDQYLNTEIEVPAEALEAYKNAEGWKHFFNLKAIDTSGVNTPSIPTDNKKAEIGRYNINGQQVDDNYKGIVILRYSDGTTRKIFANN